MIRDNLIGFRVNQILLRTGSELLVLGYEWSVSSETNPADSMDAHIACVYVRKLFTGLQDGRLADVIHQPDVDVNEPQISASSLTSCSAV